MTRFCPKCQAETERKKNGDCKPCAKVRAAIWAAKNSDLLKARYAAWRIANLDKEKANNLAWYAANIERARATRRDYQSTNAEQLKLKKAAYYIANADSIKAAVAAWHKANPEAVRINSHNRRARERDNGGKLSRGLAAKLFKLQRGKCPCCKQPLGDNFHLDHVVPIALGGSNTDDNIQLLRQRCNNQKSAKDPIDFMQQRGFLL
jgi:5-methylcytosine-specific restriction endonuclease McrA